jgi:uncharacterized OB-fold protein
MGTGTDNSELRTTTRALPVPTPATQPFWDALGRHELTVQYCANCQSHVFYPRFSCPTCGDQGLAWVRVSGRAKLHSYVINHSAAPGFEKDVPYVIAIVELDEGPRMMTNLRDVAPDPLALELDMPLEVTFQTRGGFTLPMFRPVQVAT